MTSTGKYYDVGAGHLHTKGRCPKRREEDGVKSIYKRNNPGISAVCCPICRSPGSAESCRTNSRMLLKKLPVAIMRYHNTFQMFSNISVIENDFWDILCSLIFSYPDGPKILSYLMDLSTTQMNPIPIYRNAIWRLNDSSIDRVQLCDNITNIVIEKGRKIEAVDF